MRHACGFVPAGLAAALCAMPAAFAREHQPRRSLVPSCVKLEDTQCKENRCAARNSKHQRVLQCVVASVRSVGLARLRDNRVGGGVGICVN